MRFEVVGFAGAAPLLGACPSYLVSDDGGATVLLDCGPGTVERLWRRGVLARLDAIVVSHPHMDHVLDLLPLSGEVARAAFGERRPRLLVPRGGGREVLAQLDAAFGARDRFDAAFDVAEYDSSSRLEVGDLELTFGVTSHAQPCFAARVEDGQAAVVYGADGGPTVDFARDADLLVLEATLARDEQLAAQHGHLTAGQAGALAAEAGAGRLLLTHLLPGEDGLEDRARARYAGPVELAFEGWSDELRGPAPSQGA